MTLKTTVETPQKGIIFDIKGNNAFLNAWGAFNERKRDTEDI